MKLLGILLLIALALPAQAKHPPGRGGPRPVPAPTDTLSASPTTIISGNPATLTWSSTGAPSCAGTNFSTGNATSGSVSVSPTVTTTYTVTCLGVTASAAVTVNPGGAVISSIELSNTATTTGLATATPVGTASVVLSPVSPTFTYTGTNLHLSASAADSGGTCNATLGHDNGSFQIINGDTLATNAGLTAGNKDICLAASQAGVPAAGHAFVVAVGNLIDAAATGFGCTGNGTVTSPWNYSCIQNAMNFAVAGDTVFLRGGNWALDTGDAAQVTGVSGINLVGVASGSTFDTWGHISNPAQVSGATDPCPTSGTSITCVYTTGTTYGFGLAPHHAGTVSFSSCTNDTVAHIFFDASKASDGGGQWGLLSFLNCSGPILINDMRILAYNDSNCPDSSGLCGETQFYMFQSSNYTIQNSVFADPINFNGSGYSNVQIMQMNGAGNNVSALNNVFYMGGTNPIYLSNVTYIGNQQYDYNDGLGSTAINPAIGITGVSLGGPYNVYCPEAGVPSNGQCNGDVIGNINNNLFYAGGKYFAIGGGVNDPGTAGAINNLNWSGNWIIADDGEIDACASAGLIRGTTCFSSSGIGPAINTAVSANCTESYNSSYPFSVTNNSIIATTMAVLDESGGGTLQTTCRLNPNTATVSVPVTIYGFNGQHNYLSSPSNQYITNANTISPIQQNNFCVGGVGTVTGCATSGFATPPTASFTLGPLGLGGIVPFASASFTAQYGAVQWLASTSATPPNSSDTRWISNNPFYTSPSATLPPSAPNSYVPPVSLSGVTHGNTVYLWVMDSAKNISSAVSAVIP